MKKNVNEAASLSEAKTPEPSKKEKEVFSDLETELLTQISKALNGNRVMEAYVVAWTVVEQFMLPNLIKFIAKSLKIDLPKNISELPVSQVTRLYYFLSHDKVLYDSLENARKHRNRLVHQMYKHHNWAHIKKEFKKYLKKDITSLLGLFQSRFNGSTKIPVLTLYSQGWADCAEKMIERIRNISLT